MQTHPYWDKKILGVQTYKIKFIFQKYLYHLFGITLPKMKSQKDYWNIRGEAHMSDVLDTGYNERELFFQNMLVDHLNELSFDSIFEAGCGFGWNLKRIKQTFPSKQVGGVDFSVPQIKNSEIYLKGMGITLSQGDILKMPLKNDEFDIGFSVGVFLNIHSKYIYQAAKEMVRVSKKYIIHFEYDENNTTEALKHYRKPKTNIISHDYRKIYNDLGAKMIVFQTYKNFGEAFNEYVKNISSNVHRWENFEGPEKYIFAIFEIN